MATKKRYLILATLFSLVFALTMVSAVMTFVTPTAGGTANGTFTFAVTIDSADVENALFGNWSTTDDPFFNNTGNITESQTSWNVTIDTSTLTEVEDTTLTVNISNATASITSTILINIDNTNPVCSFSIDRDVVKFQDALGIITTQSSTDLTDLTYAWTLFRSDDTSSTTSTDSAPTFSGIDFDQPDEFTLTLTVTDEASKTNACANQSIFVRGSDGDGIVRASVAAEFIDKNRTQMIIFGSVLFILLVAVAGFFIVRSQK